MEAHEPELSSAKLARLRSQVGASLQHGFDLLASRVLLEKQDGIDIFVALLMDEGTWLATLRDGNGTASAFDDDGRLTLNISLARSAAGLEGALPPKAGKGSRYVPNWFAMRRIAPGLSQLDGLLTALDVSGHPHLRTVPVNELCAIKSLASFSCDRCPRLFAPPQEIACQGGVATMKYLRIASKKAGGVVNKKIELILVGKSESGKTSVVKMLMQGKCERVSERVCVSFCMCVCVSVCESARCMSVLFISYMYVYVCMRKTEREVRVMCERERECVERVRVWVHVRVFL